MINIFKITTSLAISTSLMFTATQVPYDHLNKVTLELNGAADTYVTEKESIGDFLEEQGIHLKAADKINLPLHDSLEKTEKVIIEKAKKITVQADGKEYKFTAYDEDVATVLDKLDIELEAHDRVNVAMADSVSHGMMIEIERVEIKQEKLKLSISHSHKKVDSSTLLKGTNKVQTAGKDGQREIITETVYVNGEVESEEVLSSSVTQEPQTEITLVGTKEVVVKKAKAEVKKLAPQTQKTSTAKKTSTSTSTNKTTTSQSTSSEDNKNWKSFTLSFYTDLPSENGGYTVTATGEKLRSGMVASNYYAIGTNIYLSGWGSYTVKDRGGSNFNSSNRLDVFIPRKSGESNGTYLNRVNKMGLKTVKGYVK